MGTRNTDGRRLVVCWKVTAIGSIWPKPGLSGCAGRPPGTGCQLRGALWYHESSGQRGQRPSAAIGLCDHWQIEHGLRYRRDVTLEEATSQVRMGSAPHILACLNHAICGLAAHGGQSNLAPLQRSMAAAIDRILFHG